MNKKNSTIALFLTILGLSLFATPMFGQTKTVYRNIDGARVAVHYTEIPEATEPCEPIVCEWWKKLRHAANELQRKGDEKSKKEFVELFLEGLEKSYKIPMKNQAPKVLVMKRPQTDELVGVMKRLNAKLVLSVEHRFDGSIGDVKVIEKVTPEVENRFIQALRQNIFLPAIKDAAFVTEWQKAEFKYTSRGRF